MSINRITIKNSEGVCLGVVTGTLAVKAGPDTEPVQLEASAADRSATISSPWYSDVYAKAKDTLTFGYYITRINNTLPADDGSFFISGSGCFSWSYVAGKEEAGDSVLYPNAISVTDLCAACSTCDVYVRIRKLVEGLKLMFNALKDVNLYADATAKSRQNWLRSKRSSVPIGCTQALDGIDTSVIELQSNRLLGQYVTAVHMWNWLVGHKNNTTQLTNAPENAGGLYLATSFTKPVCSSSVDVSCTVEITQSSGQSGLSLYVTEPRISFSPDTQDGGASMRVTKSMSSATKVTVSASRASGGSAGSKVGTYMLTFKCLPFYKVQLTDSDGNTVDPASMNTNLVDKETTPSANGGEDYLYKLKIAQAMSSIRDATYSDYVHSQNYLSTASTVMNVWKATVTWRLTGTMSSTETSTYYLETPGVRELRAGMYRDTKLHNPTVTETETE